MKSLVLMMRRRSGRRIDVVDTSAEIAIVGGARVEIDPAFRSTMFHPFLTSATNFIGACSELLLSWARFIRKLISAPATIIEATSTSASATAPAATARIVEVTSRIIVDCVDGGGRWLSEGLRLNHPVDKGGCVQRADVHGRKLVKQVQGKTLDKSFFNTGSQAILIGLLTFRFRWHCKVFRVVIEFHSVKKRISCFISA